MSQYRSKIDFAAILAGNLEGFNLGIDGSVFLREEAIERTFNAPRIGTQGDSIGAIGASTDISGGTDTDLDIAVDGGSALTVTLDVVGKNTGLLIAEELETKINAALAAASLDLRVWVEFDGGDDHYEVYSQQTGASTSIVITDASSNNVADDLLLGVANGGTETVGSDDQDFLLYTTGGGKFEQPVESNPHRSERYHVGVLKQKKVVDFDIDTMINMEGNAGDSIDEAIKLLNRNTFGTETIVPNTSIQYKQGLPNFTFSMVRASTLFAEYITGCYVKNYTLTVPGDSSGKVKYVGFGSDAAIAGIGKLNGAVVASTDVILVNSPYKHIQRFTAGAKVMAVKADGRTITAGADGSLEVVSATEATDTLVLNSAIDLEDEGFITYWHPGAVQQTGIDNIATDLEGSFYFEDSEHNVCATNIVFSYSNDHVDRINCFGTDANQGFISGNRATPSLEVTLDLSNDHLGYLIKARQFGGFSPKLIIGDIAGRHIDLTAPNWIVSVPPIELPENGATPVTYSGNLYQSSPNARDPFLLQYK